MDDYTLCHVDELPAVNHGAVKLAGDALGLDALGLQVLDLPGGFTEYPEHDHSDDGQEEVYIVLRGSVELAVGDESVRVDEGGLVRVSSSARRKLLPGKDGVRVLAIGAVPGRYVRPDGFRIGPRG